MSSTCKGCGRPVVWASIIKADGTRGTVPLDPSAPVYVEKPMQGWVRDTSAMVSHFATCSHANDFGSGKRRDPLGDALNSGDGSYKP